VNDQETEKKSTLCSKVGASPQVGARGRKKNSIIQQKDNILLDHVENLIDLLVSRNMFINVTLQAMTDRATAACRRS
jgi:hypothetical protein